MYRYVGDRHKLSVGERRGGHRLKKASVNEGVVGACVGWTSTNGSRVSLWRRVPAIHHFGPRSGTDLDLIDS